MSARSLSHTAGLDSVLIATTVLLSGFGAVMIYSATAPLAGDVWPPPHFVRHALALVPCVLCAWAAAKLPLRGRHALSLPLWGFAVAALLVTAWMGARANGAQRWLPLPGIGAAFQPGELAKLATVLAVASVVARRDGRGPLAPRRFAMAAVLGAIPAGLLLLQPDLGNALLLLGLVGALLFAAGARLVWLGAPGVVVGLGAAGYVATHPYAWRRLVGFSDPWATAQSHGYQLVQSFISFGRGGLYGEGFGYGRQKLYYLPEAHTDFVLSVVAEELGLVGVLAVLVAFVVLLVAGLRIALQARQRFAALLAFGSTLLLCVPAAINAAVVMGMAPTKGLGLPFVSYGRSSLLICSVVVGLLIGIARHGERLPAARPVATRRRAKDSA